MKVEKKGRNLVAFAWLVLFIMSSCSDAYKPVFSNKTRPEIKEAIVDFFEANRNADIEKIYSLVHIQQEKKSFIRDFASGRFPIKNIKVTSLDERSVRIEYQIPTLCSLINAILEGNNDIIKVTRNLAKLGDIGVDYDNRSEIWYFVADEQKRKIDYQKSKILKFISINGDLIYSYCQKKEEFLNVRPSKDDLPFRISFLISAYLSLFDIKSDSPDGLKLTKDAIDCAKSTYKMQKGS